MDLADYIFTYYQHLLTPEEKAGHKSLMGYRKVEGETNPATERLVRKLWISEDPKVLKLLADGPDKFKEHVRDRVMRDHADEIFFNYCPRCGALAKAPTAKQCPKCFFSWHDYEQPPD